jgi:hypothetical protein
MSTKIQTMATKWTLESDATTQARPC